MDASLERIATWARRLAGAEPISIGWNCNTAHYLEAVGARRAAYPFDWTFSSSDIVADAITRRFDDFVDPTQLVPIDGATAAGHRRYHARMFAHHDPVGSPETRGAYDRRIARFLARFDDACPLCLVATVLPEPDRRPGWKKGFVHDFALPDARHPGAGDRAVRSLAALREGPTYLVVIRQWTCQPDRRLTVTAADPDRLVLNVASVGLNDGRHYVQGEDDALCRRIYAALFKAHGVGTGPAAR